MSCYYPMDTLLQKRDKKSVELASRDREKYYVCGAQDRDGHMCKWWKNTITDRHDDVSGCECFCGAILSDDRVLPMSDYDFDQQAAP